MSVFNNQAVIQIGGKWNRVKQRIERPFGGIISGLVFNGLRILDLAYEKDRRTEIRGDVTRVTAVKNRIQEPMQYQQMQPVRIFLLFTQFFLMLLRSVKCVRIIYNLKSKEFRNEILMILKSINGKEKQNNINCKTTE